MSLPPEASAPSYDEPTEDDFVRLRLVREDAFRVLESQRLGIEALDQKMESLISFIGAAIGGAAGLATYIASQLPSETAPWLRVTILCLLLTAGAFHFVSLIWLVRGYTGIRHRIERDEAPKLTWLAKQTVECLTPWDYQAAVIGSVAKAGTANDKEMRRTANLRQKAILAFLVALGLYAVSAGLMLALVLVWPGSP